MTSHSCCPCLYAAKLPWPAHNAAQNTSVYVCSCTLVHMHRPWSHCFCVWMSKSLCPRMSMHVQRPCFHCFSMWLSTCVYALARRCTCRDHATPDNPPVLLPCNHVLCEQSVLKIAKGRSKTFKCPYCPMDARTDNLRALIFPDLD
jgi:hypothetical protein